MTPTETAAILRQFNEWRRGDEDIPQFDPREIGEAIDAAVEMIDRLEVTEGDIILKERIIDSLGSTLNAVANERDALLARIEEMERQEPVAWCATDETGTVIEALGMNQSRRFDAPLYLAPGAQPAPSIPELLESLRCACNYIDKLGGVSQQYRAMLASLESKP